MTTTNAATTAAAGTEETAEIYLGIATSDGERCHVWAQLRYRVGGAATTVEHEQVDSTERLSVSFTVVAAHWRISERHSTPDDFPESYYRSGGQVAPENRMISERSAALTSADLAFVETVWERWHLNDMKPGCAHMPSYEQIAAQVAKLDEPPMQYGRLDVTGWAIKNVACPTTGYTYGHAWLYEAAPAATVQRFRTMIAAHKGGK